MTKSSEKNKLEKFAEGYIKPDSGRIIDTRILALIVDEIMPWVKGPKVLEMGFGDDAWTAKLIKKFGSSSIVDASEVVLKKANHKYRSKVKTYTSLFEDFKPELKYDTVIASYVLEHVEDPIEIMYKSSQWIKSNGHVLVVVPHADSFHRRLAVAMGLQKKTEELGATDKKIGHRRVFTMAHMEKDIKAAGLKIHQKKGLFVKFLPQNMMTSWSNELFDGFMKLGGELPMEYSGAIVYDCVHAKK